MNHHKANKYRPCVGIMLLNEDKKVWVGKRISISKFLGEDRYIWQMPQGGIDEGETPEDAAMRELLEEVGTNKARIIGEHPEWLSYDLPVQADANLLKGKFVGQRQKWFALEFTGQSSDFNLSPEGDEPAEFSDWMWTEMEKLPELIVPFKRDVYLEVVNYFSRELLK